MEQTERMRDMQLYAVLENNAKSSLPDMVITVVLCLIVEKVAEAMRK